jgi:hypothetical protein
MLGQLNYSFVLITSAAVTLTACNPAGVEPQNAIENPSPTAPTAALASPSESPSVVRQAKQTVNRSPSSSTNRDNYRPISSDQMARVRTLGGDDPQAIALEAFGNPEAGSPEGGSQEVNIEYPQSDLAVVTITQTNIADDSVNSIRYRVELAPKPKDSQTDKQWEIVWAGSQFICQQGRGHQEWSPELCS